MKGEGLLFHWQAPLFLYLSPPLYCKEERGSDHRTQAKKNFFQGLFHLILPSSFLPFSKANQPWEGKKEGKKKCPPFGVIRSLWIRLEFHLFLPPLYRNRPIYREQELNLERHMHMIVLKWLKSWFIFLEWCLPEPIVPWKSFGRAATRIRIKKAQCCHSCSDLILYSNSE